MRFLRASFLTLAVVVAIAAVAVFLSLPSNPPSLKSAGESRFDLERRAVGVLHVHSNYSDGSGGVTEILSAAKLAGLDFVVLTDHRDPEALRNEGQEYRDGVLLLAGSEVATEGGHVLALDIPDPVLRFGTDTADTLRDIDEMGGFAIAAHPYARRAHFAWADWDVGGLAGIELFNFFSGWRRQSGWSVGIAAAVYPFSPRRALAAGLDWEPRAFARWDATLTERDMVAWVGLDAHGHASLPGGFELPWPSYRSVFEMARNHLVLDEPLVGDAVKDRALIYDALENGQGFMSFDGWSDGSRFRFHAEDGSREWPIGSRIPFETVQSGSLRLVASVESPVGTRLRLLKNGKALAESKDRPLSLPLDGPGTYRVEAHLDTRFVPGRREQPWIVSNPIFVSSVPTGPTEKTAHRPARRTEFPPLPSPASAETMSCQPLGEEPWKMAFHAEHDPASRMDEESALSLGDSFRMEFQLSEPGDDQPYVWCAVVDRTPRDLTRFDAIRFQVRGEAMYRVTVQLRDARAGASVEDTEWWARSFTTSGEWRDVFIPFARLRSISETSDGKLDLERTRGLFFVLDAGNTRPGTSGVIEVRGLEFCAGGH